MWGEVLAGEAVTRVEVADRRVVSVTTATGRSFTATHYIAAVSPLTLFTLTGEAAFPRAYRQRLASLTLSGSAFSLFIKLRGGAFPYINHTEFFMTRYADVWRFADPTAPWPLGFLFMTPPEEGQGEWARKAIITAPMTFEPVRQWETTVTGRRGDSYREWKREQTERILTSSSSCTPASTTA